MESTIKKINIFGWIAIIIGIAFLVWCVTGGLESCGPDKLTNTTEVIQQPNLAVIHADDVKHDTVIKFVDKIKTVVKIEPEKIYLTKLDSIFFIEHKYSDFMLRVNKKGSVLEIDAVNYSDSLLKRYIYNNVGNDFTATSQNKNIFVKSRRIYWNGLNAYIEYIAPLDSNIKKFNGHYLKPGLTTGINYMNKLYLDGGVGYDLLRKEPFASLRLTYKFVQ